MSQQELREEAKALGLKYIGVSQDKLRKAVEEAKTLVKSPVKVPKEKIKGNTAVVRNIKKQEIRRYNLETHGDNFVDLAKEFANQHEYNVELIEAKTNTVCSNCGHVLE